MRLVTMFLAFERESMAEGKIAAGPATALAVSILAGPVNTDRNFETSVSGLRVGYRNRGWTDGNIVGYNKEITAANCLNNFDGSPGKV
ncbi:hypothetical protein GWO53_04610 [Corynebacterium macginleyi]|uniref:hypothetical protein n=1 Tax=Corynebacterium macginleyi TaxID=38290 RepID=UPI0011C46C2D|nr:hypothetical protein [Corynebacterium macginleyi]MBK4139788.1 hypothetical protein [Corynebacterium macginleyi]MBK4143171.1 hypothetical protein [Corynebacterium macginleyi]MBK4148481.1 hypothetical protein [Corynebacterium macginleyi]MBK4152513.1 hypothetical protein [Corynebacterium macginleyi]MBK4159207.1 hypothetical protein [Corynebacterium macginleyi]